MENLLDLLSILIAFAALMLLLSLIVTSAVQTLQYVLRLRIRNLRLGLGDLLAVASGRSDEEAGAAAKRILTSLPIAQARMGWPRRIVETSWITKEELQELMKRDGFGLKAQREADRWFGRFEANLEKTFLTRIRWLTIVCALGVAVLFQVDAFETLRELSVNPELRTSLAASAPELLEEYQAEIDALRDPRTVAEEALVELERETDGDPEGEAIERAIEQVAGIGPERSDLLEELRLALFEEGVGDPARTATVDLYSDLLTRITAARAEQADALRDRAMGDLARFSITPWGRTTEFYWRPGGPYLGLRPGRYLGVLVTAVFLSFGAPFWFNRLRDLIALRDQLEKVLRPGPKPKSTTPETT